MTLRRSVDITPQQLLALHAANPRRYPALLESAAAGEPLGRFDILFAFPGARLTLHGPGRLTDERGAASAGRFLEALDAWWRREHAPSAAGDADRSLPFTGGWLLYLGYELAGEIEPRLVRPGRWNWGSGPIAQAVRVPAALIYEHGSGRGWLIAEPGAEALLEDMARDLEATGAPPAAPPERLALTIEEDPPEQYLRAVQRGLEYIAAGDIYQTNLSRGWRAELAPGVLPQHVYARLRQTNPGPFSGLAVLDDLAIVSSSPERLIEVRDGWIATRPIAGTRPRGKDAQSDNDLARELHGHPKERAEHVMLIDLERNDLGRVCEAGTVVVDEFMTIESYAHVHHIVSNIRGRLRPQVTPGEALAAVFPGGTITGCPKVRCMEIIAEQEGTARGAYTGSLGYLNRDGSMDMNILIRTFEVRGSTLTLRAGAGIVADSVPERELQEARQKAFGLLRALGEEPSSS